METKKDTGKPRKTQGNQDSSRNTVYIFFSVEQLRDLVCMTMDLHVLQNSDRCYRLNRDPVVQKYLLGN